MNDSIITHDFASLFTIDDLIAYATINYIPNPTTDLDIEQIDTILPELRDTTDEIAQHLPMNTLDNMLDSDIDIFAAHISTLTDDPTFYRRLLDIALARRAS